MMPRRRPTRSIRQQFARIVVAATVAMVVTAVVTAYVVVGGAMRHDLDKALARDAAVVAGAYDGRGEGAPTSLSGPTGRVRVQLYTAGGVLLAASDPAFEAEDRTLPRQVVAAAPGTWRGALGDGVWHAATAPFSAGVVVVLADAGYVEAALGRVARSMAWLGAALTVVSVLLASWVAGAVTGPIRALATAVRDRGPGDLEPLVVPTAHHEVAGLANAFDDLLGRLRAAHVARNRFLAETSHELRTPLTSLHGFVHRARRAIEGAQRGPGDDPRPNPRSAVDDLADAERIAVDMAHKVDDLLDLARGDARPALELHLLDLGDQVVAPVVAEYPRVHHGGREGTLVVGDPQRLRQIVRNLVANAVRATAPNGTVQVHWCTEEADAVVRVEDDGPGVPTAIVAHLFEPFARGPSGGSGLGLGVARGWARAHGGDVHLEANADPHTVFALRIPRFVDEAEADVDASFDGVIDGGEVGVRDGAT